MTGLIVALSTADVTVRAGAVGLLAIVAIAIVAGRVDWTQFRRSQSKPSPVYLRVDQRPGQIYRPPSIRRRAAATGGLAGFAVAGGIAIALVFSVVVAVLVESITGLLR